MTESSQAGLQSSKSATEIIGQMQDELGKPLMALLEISDRCNEVCLHCYQVQGQKGEMTTEQLLGLVDRLAEAGVLILTLSGGEALLRPDFLQIARHARKRGFMLRVFTNGLLVDAAMAKAFAELAVETVEISLYSPDAEMHDFVTGVPRSFERTVRGIRALTAEQVPVVVKTPMMSVNENQLDAYRQLVADLGARLRLDPTELMPREGGDNGPWALNPSLETVRAQMAGDGHWAPTGDEPASVIAHRSHDDVICGAGKSVHVEPHGQLRPCTMLDIDLGDVSAQPLEEVRASSEALAGMLTLRFGDLHGCRDCDLSGYCSHCYATALAETGDALGPQPSACRGARAHYEARHKVPLEIHAAERPSEAGPFELVSLGHCKQIPDVVTEADRVRAQRLGWVRGAPSDVSVVPARPGELVQLRRPGMKRPIKQRVPSGVQGPG